MTATNERYYVRFKGRVLGPLDHDKTTELIRRGQITRQHELSLDGTLWRAAGEYTRLFSGEKSSRPQDNVIPVSQPQPTTNAHADVWYANIDNENQGPVAEDVLKSWASDNKLKPDTLVWTTGMTDWQTAETVRPKWFALRPNELVEKSSPEPLGDIEQLANTLLASYRWIQVLSITSLVFGVMAFIVTILFFLSVAIIGGSGPAKVMNVIFSFFQLGIVTTYFIAAWLLLKYSGRLAVFKFRHEPSDFVAAAKALNRFWKFTGIVALVWIASLPALFLIAFLLGSIPVLYDKNSDVVDLESAPKNGASVSPKE